MTDSNKTPKDSETIMMALDQISQTIDVMNSVVGRLRHHVQKQEAAAAESIVDIQAEMHSDRVLH